MNYEERKEGTGADVMTDDRLAYDAGAADGYWALLEIMGHISIIGLVRDVQLHGTTVIEVTVPPVPSTEDEPAIPGYVQRFGGGSLFRETPLSEARALEMIARRRTWPPNLAQPARPLDIVSDREMRQLNSYVGHEDEFDEDDDEDALPDGTGDSDGL